MLLWQAYHVQEQVDGLSVFALHSLHILSQLKQSGGCQLWNDTRVKKKQIKQLERFYSGGRDLSWGKGWQCLEKSPELKYCQSSVPKKPFIPHMSFIFISWQTMITLFCEMLKLSSISHKIIKGKFEM